MKISLFNRLKEFLRKSKRVFLVTKKPTRKEYFIVIKITGLGILLIGLLGFVITIIGQLYF